MSILSGTPPIKLAFLAIVAAGSFVAVLALLNSGGAPSASAADPDPFAPTALSVVEPGVPPPPVDTSRPLWYERYVAADAVEPRPAVVLAGITIGQSLNDGSPSCPQDQLRTVSGDALHSNAAVARQLTQPKYLPNGAKLDHETAVFCAGELVWYTLGYTLPTDDLRLPLVAQGKASWFGVAHGGFVEITRLRTTNPSVSTAVPQGRLSERRINNSAAVVAAPIMKAGFGEAFAAT